MGGGADRGASLPPFPSGEKTINIFHKSKHAIILVERWWFVLISTSANPQIPLDYAGGGADWDPCQPPPSPGGGLSRGAAVMDPALRRWRRRIWWASGGGGRRASFEEKSVRPIIAKNSHPLLFLILQPPQLDSLPPKYKVSPGSYSSRFQKPPGGGFALGEVYI